MTEAAATALSPRRQQILEVLAQELEKSPGARVTTANLARSAGVSEAALYRHFPSKAKMFEALITFAEESVFARINRILAQEQGAPQRCEKIVLLTLTFSQRNPGITRVLLGEALVGEHARLRTRVSQFFDRLETTLRQVLRENILSEESGFSVVRARSGANLLVAYIEGRMVQYVRSDFRISPLELWEQQWPVLGMSVFAEL